MSKPLFGGPECSWPAFEPVNDTVRGGASTSSWTVDPSTNIGTFSGVLDITALGGAGFASQSASFEPPLRLGSRSRTAGLLVTFIASSFGASSTAAGSKRPYKLVLALKEEKPSRRPDGRRESVTVYQYTIDLNDYRDDLEDDRDVSDVEKGVVADAEKQTTSVTVLARWDQFKPTYRGRPKEDADPLNPEQIYELSFMCRSNFGEQAGEFSFDVVSLAIAPASHGRSFGGFGLAWFRHLFQIVTMRLASAWAFVASIFPGRRGGGGGAVRLP
ncbi:hypothetical protein JCM3774_000443 [Rhodotorula dairenensis]